MRKENGMRTRTRALYLGLSLAAALPVLAAAPEAPPPKGPAPITVRIHGETLKLPNGMTFVLVERPGAPTFAGYIGFRVGGVDSVPGDTGLAHMFEHMAFKGTEHIGTTDWAKEKPIYEALEKAGDELTMMKAEGKGTPEQLAALAEKVKELSKKEHRYIKKDEFDYWYTLAGERAENASTGEDLTQYFVMLPSNSLELWMLMESQRIREPVLREFYSERSVIEQERLMRTDNDPMGKLYEQFEATAFMAHPYRLPTIGWASDVRALTMAKAQAFFHEYYSPSNAVGVLVGNFDVAQAKRWIAEFFGTIPRRGDPAPIVTKEPKQEEGRCIKVAFDANPQMLIGWHKPTWPSPDDTRMDIISNLLTDGVTSRLYRRLVEEDHLVLDVQSWNDDPGARYDNLFVIQASPNEGVPYEKVEKAITEEVDRLKTAPVPAAELEKAKTRILASYLRRLDSTLSTAMLVGTTQLITGDWHNIEGYLRQVQAVTPQEIQKTAATYLTTGNRTVATLVKPPEAGKEAQR